MEPEKNQKQREEVSPFGFLGMNIITFVVVGAIMSSVFYVLGITDWVYYKCLQVLTDISFDGLLCFLCYGRAILSIIFFFGWGRVGTWIVREWLV